MAGKPKPLSTGGKKGKPKPKPKGKGKKKS
jgi:hypothetical protein